jgi:hypothetical protein
MANKEIYPKELVDNSVLGTNTLRKLQDELNRNKRRQVKLIDQKLYHAKSAREKRKRDIKSADLITIKETLNSIYKEYHSKMSTKRISTLKEFQGILLLGLALFDALDSYSLEGKEDKVGEYKKLLDEHRKLKMRLEKYENYGRRYASAKEIEGFEVERIEIKNELSKIERELDNFTKTFFTKIFQDYNNFKDFLSDKETEIDRRAEILKTLAELSTLDEYLSQIPEEEGSSTVFEKLSIYQENVKTLYIKGKSDGEETNVTKTLANKIGDILENVSQNGNIINVALHLQWANILINHNIMRYPAIAEEYENSRISAEVKSIRNLLIGHYTRNNYDENKDKVLDDELVYHNDVPVRVKSEIGVRGIGKPSEEEFKLNRNIVPEVTEKHYDDLFYDLLILNRRKYLENLLEENEKKEHPEELKFDFPEFKTFKGLDSPRKYLDLGNRAGNISFDQEAGTVRIDCTLDDFVMISNALHAMEALNVEASYNNVLSLLGNNGEWNQNSKFKLKERYSDDFDVFANSMDEAEEIREKLIEKEQEMNFLEMKVLYYLLSRLNYDNEERVQAGYLLSDKNFFEKIVYRLIKTVRKKEEPVKSETAENIEGDEIDESEGIMAKKKQETLASEKVIKKEEEKYEITPEQYMEEQEKVVDGIRGLILNIRNLNKIMSTNKVQELSEFEKVVENIKNFKISENETLQEWFKKEPERQKEIEDMQKTIISSLEVENF